MKKVPDRTRSVSYLVVFVNEISDALYGPQLVGISSRSWTFEDLFCQLFSFLVLKFRSGSLFLSFENSVFPTLFPFFGCSRGNTKLLFYKVGCFIVIKVSTGSQSSGFQLLYSQSPVGMMMRCSHYPIISYQRGKG